MVHLTEDSLSEKLERFERLNTLLNEGKLTASEYEVLRSDIFKDPHEVTAGDSPPQVEPEESPTKPPIDSALKVALTMGILSIFFGGYFGLVAWSTIAVSGWALYKAEARSRGRWMAWTGLVLGIMFSLSNAAMNEHIGQETTNSESFVYAASDSPPELTTTSSTTPPTTLPEPKWEVGSCAKSNTNGIFWYPVHCNGIHDALVIATEFLVSLCPENTEISVKVSDGLAACLVEVEG